MGKLQLFQVSFAGNKTEYGPGEMVAGQLDVQLSSPMDMTAIKLKFAGKAYVHWTESHGSGENQRTEHYSATEHLFRQAIVVYGKGSSTSNDRSSLSQGLHSFPFTFQLPQTLPSSYQDSIGFIRYYLKATIARAWKFNHNIKAVFTVLDVLDLNTLPNVLACPAVSESKMLCCWCCSSGPIEVDFHLDRSGYVPGEWVRVNARVTNASNSNVPRTSIDLMQIVTYHATTKSRVDWKSTNRLTVAGCGPNSSVAIDERVHIPPLPPSENAHCRIIDIEYAIQCTVHLRTCAIDLHANAPITIGTIPLRGVEENGNPSAPPPSVPAPSSGAISAQPLSVALPPIANDPAVPPPTYAQASTETGFANGGYYDWSQSAFTYK